jgi:hypothetical protein
LDDLAGLSTETVAKALPLSGSLGAIGEAKLQVLQTDTNQLVSLLHKQQGNELTPAIQAEDATRDGLFSDIKRVSKAASKSTLEVNAAAGAKLVEFLKTYWNIGQEPMMSQTVVIKLMIERYLADPALMSAATTVGLIPVFDALMMSNNHLSNLYDQRVDEIVAAEGPSATSVKSDLVISYEEFCDFVKMALSTLPSPGLQTLFGDINEIRRKYVARLPKRLDEKHTVVEPIDMQVYTGKPVTPLPKVHYRADNETVELQFAQDFYVTYRQNIDVGEAKLSVHGKGKYAGRYETSFHIKRI